MGKESVVELALVCAGANAVSANAGTENNIKMDKNLSDKVRLINSGFKSDTVSFSFE